jgi:sulfoxide reductase heme-binding subunit YedZ
MKAWILTKTSKYWKENKRSLAKILHPLVHIGSVIPFAVDLLDFWQNNLGANPILEITHRTGRTALTLLLISLSVSPLRLLLNWPQINKLRRPIGLYAFTYAAIHFGIFIILDFNLQWEYIFQEILNRKFILFGFSAGVILLLLAVTSLKVFLKKLGKRWKKLHRFVYAAGFLATLHFILAVKPGVLRPWYYAAIMLMLLSFRLPQVQSWVKERVQYRSKNK